MCRETIKHAHTHTGAGLSLYLSTHTQRHARVWGLALWLAGCKTGRAYVAWLCGLQGLTKLEVGEWRAMDNGGRQRTVT